MENTKTPQPEEYFTFLSEVLGRVSKDPSPQSIYPFLEQNLNKLNDDFGRVLENRAREILPSADSARAKEIAYAVFYFSNLINNFPQGNIANNIEIAIIGYQIVLSVYTLKNFPENWAVAKNNLAKAYTDRIRGVRAKNLELAIDCIQEALKVFTYKDFPEDWAAIQDNLATAYTKRIGGDRAENLELAIACYTEALKVRTLNAFPHDWAMTQNNLAVAYHNRIRGERAENLELAIDCIQEALKVFTYKDYQQQWADAQDNLANVYRDRIKGVRAENLELALSYCHEALKVRTLDAFPQDWAATQNNLANVYAERIRGDRAENLDLAIFYYHEALKVRTLDAFPQDWAVTQNNLAATYRDKIKGDRAENLELAIACYTEALKVRTLNAFPHDWAMTKNNLANAYSQRILGEPDDNLEMAISCFKEALMVFTFEASPQNWAMTKNNLATIYQKRIRGERAKNLKLAIDYFREALVVRTKEKDPINCLQTARNLGNLHFWESDWEPATIAYSTAIEAAEISRLEALNPHRRQEILSDAVGVYHNIVQSYLNLYQPDKALEYVERSKTRNLVEFLANRDLLPKGDFSPDIIARLSRIRRAIVTQQQQLAIQEQKTTNEQKEKLFLIDYTHLNQLQQKLEEFIESEITPVDPNFISIQKVTTIPFDEIQGLINEPNNQTAILEWYITGDKILGFIITQDSLKVWQSSFKDRENLGNWMNEYLRTYDTNRKHWKAHLETSLTKLAEILHLDEIISSVPLEYDRLIFIPHHFLHILPLHALPVSPQIGRRAGGEGKYLLDLFPRGVQYAPSCQLLKLVQSQKRPNFENLFAIQNPTEDLICADLEVETIRSFLPSSEVLAKQAATEQAVKNYQNFSSVHCAHFSCHGKFNPKSPLESALILADQEWTLGEIFELFLPQCRLVTLSACETGFTDPRSLSDEYIGLPNGFLFAGSPSVVSSLWTVDDCSTAFLMIKFYENLTPLSCDGRGAGGEGVSVAIALQTAQQWLRNLTIEELDKFREKYKAQFEKTFAQWRSGQLKRFKESLEQARQRQLQPFANPYYWAAFMATGF